jgi:hypothetical protein
MGYGTVFKIETLDCGKGRAMDGRAYRPRVDGLMVWIYPRLEHGESIANIDQV